MKSVFNVAAVAAAMLVAQGAMAYEAGDWIVRTGAVKVDPDEKSSALKLEGVGALGGTGVSAGKDTQLLLNITYMVTPALGVELLAATPFSHSVSTRGLTDLGLTDVKLGDIKHLPPTLTLLWYPMPGASRFQPFIGGGLNYTLFFGEDVSGAAENALGASDLNLDDSFGLAFRAGFDFMLDEVWSFHAGAYYLDISTDASVDTALGKVKVGVDVDPWVYTIGIGYRF